jgi:SAM-dependent methyltransferase
MISTIPLERAAPLQGSLTIPEMERLLALAERFLLREPLLGVGLELGAGLGVLSAIAARRAAVEYVLAVEVCENFVRLVIPDVARQALGDRADRVVPVWGSFDALQLPDESVHFVVEIDSLHHADDLAQVLGECSRVLKRGGQLLCFDRAQPDELPEEVRQRMLDHIYGPDWIEENGYPPGITMTRRENGEHEIRMREWLEAFSTAGLSVDRIVHFEPEITKRMAAKAAVSMLPRPIRTRLISMPLPATYLRAWGATRLRIRDSVGAIVFAPRHTTGFAVSRP